MGHSFLVPTDSGTALPVHHLEKASSSLQLPLCWCNDWHPFRGRKPRFCCVFDCSPLSTPKLLTVGRDDGFIREPEKIPCAVVLGSLGPLNSSFDFVIKLLH